MNRRTAKFSGFAAVFILLSSTFSGSFAQQGSLDQPSLNEGSIFIWNGTTRSVTFYLSSDNSNFEKFKLGTDEVAKPDYGKKVTNIYFAVKTGDKLIQRDLKAQHRYKLVLEDSIIDIKEIVR
ncbi:hypothetical protein [Rhizobium leguminosarum]|uniref:Uncharacterized protein n=1 Tax=Rhizobium leguminosarum TaxID=384 RepID=A0A7K3VJD1_RHILE|nr:hypothetical protein [Rhizobium leguminosarum]NEK16201.1 hypothetical protein [Rhizobium leguminosarum]